MQKRTSLILLLMTMLILSGCQGFGDLPVAGTPTTATSTPTGDRVNAQATATAIVAAVKPITNTTGITDLLTANSTVTITSTEVITDADAITGTDAITSTESAVPESDGLITIPPLPTDMTDMTIAQIISTTTGFETLASGLATVGLLEVLDAPGPLTLFAPTNNAFVIYPDDTIPELSANPAILLDLLQYHVIVDRAPSATLAELGATVTAMGELVEITLDANGTFLANEAVIIQSDIQAANGIIHVINGILVPSTAEGLLIARTVNPQAATDTGARAISLELLAAADTSDQTVLEIVNTTEGFATLASAVNAAGLTDALSVDGPITLLAPVNSAFEDMPDGELEALLNTNPDELVRIVQYHTILDLATSADLAQLPTALTPTGDTVTVTVDGNSGIITLNDGAATVFMADIEASNGVIHAISAVLTPPAQ